MKPDYVAIRNSLLALMEGGEMPWESAVVSLIALLKDHHSKVSWVGFYRFVDGELWIGPYQGKLACTRIALGKGVCGTSFQKAEAILVQDVHAFEGHIACDALSRSELVIPVWRKTQLVGVLDLDSYEPSAFSQNDLDHIRGLIEDIDCLSRDSSSFKF